MYLEFFFFNQKTAYEMRISDWSADVCSSDLPCPRSPARRRARTRTGRLRHCARARRRLRRPPRLRWRLRGDRKSVVEGKSVAVSVDQGGRRIIKKKIPPSYTDRT